MAKHTPITPAQAAAAEWREIYKFETTTPALGGTPAFDIDDDPTAGHMNAPIVQMMQNMEILRHRAPSNERNAILSAKLSASTGFADFFSISGNDLTIQGASTPLVLSFAAGYGRTGAIDFVGYVDTDEVLDVTGANGPVFALYDTATGAVSFEVGVAITGFTGFEVSTTEPSLVSNNVPLRYWWNPSSGKVHRTEGTPGSVAWVEVCAVCLGFVITGTSTATCRDIGATGDDASAIPAGTVTAFASENTPQGWLQCDGSAVSRTTYHKLFDLLGTAFGAGNGTTTFNIPDLRGYFVRGYDDGRGVDSGRVFGSNQADANLAHTHGVVQVINGSGSVQIQTTGGAGALSTATNSSGGAEARPKNVAMNYIIKF